LAIRINFNNLQMMYQNELVNMENE